VKHAGARLLVAAALAAGLAGCGGDDAPAPAATAPPAEAQAEVVVAALGDSITAGTPLWDPDPAVRAQIGDAADERHTFLHWAAQRLGDGVAFRNCGVNRERTDEIALRLDACAEGADVLLVQGGINDVAQGADLDAAADNLRAMVRRGTQRGLRVAIAELLPWNNGFPDAVSAVDALNEDIRAIGDEEGATVLAFYEALEDPANPDRMREQLTIDGDHPSLEGHRRLGAAVRLP
jgi:lysophospholipase L1-like esterase